MNKSLTLNRSIVGNKMQGMLLIATLQVALKVLNPEKRGEGLSIAQSWYKNVTNPEHMN